jgi:[FeFe] hydrogenase H-cluster maturation GTPase HydF
MRVEKSYQALSKTDIALVVVDGNVGVTAEDRALIDEIKSRNLPYIVVLNKAEEVCSRYKLEDKHIWVSAKTGENINELKELIAGLLPDKNEKRLIADMLKPCDEVVLVVPIDSAAPKGRLIMPQQQTIRDILEAGAIATVTRDTELEQTLASRGKRPRLVVTDSQAFNKVKAIVPEDMPLTSFSILFARYKGNLKQAVEGVKALESLEDGDTVLIAEGCTHHRQCDDIGTVKIPRWLENYCSKAVKYEFTSGTEFPKDLSRYKLVIHCGGCTLNEKEMQYRLSVAEAQGVPMTNYGIFIAHTQGILKRSVSVFSDIADIL